MLIKPDHWMIKLQIGICSCEKKSVNVHFKDSLSTDYIFVCTNCTLRKSNVIKSCSY